MKKFAVLFLVFILFFCTFFNAHSIDIDGNDKGAEWDGAEPQVILNQESNCKVNFGLVKWITDAEINTIYLCIMFKEPDLLSDNLNAGVSVQINNSDPFIITPQNTPTQFDIDKYYFDGAIKIDDNGGATCEVRIGMKYGLPDVINGKIRFYDSEGSPSNVYDFSIENTETTTVNLNHYENGSGEKTPSDSSYKTTSKNQNKTTKPATTTKKSSNSGMNIDYGLLDLLFSEETTAKTTRSSTTNSKQTTTVKKSKNNKPDNNNIKNKEKTEKPETISLIETSTAEITASDTTSSGKAESKPSAAELDIYKIVIIVAGGITLVAISVLGTLKSKKENNSKSDRNS